VNFYFLALKTKMSYSYGSYAYDHPGFAKYPSNYVSLQNYNCSGLDRVGKLAPLTRLRGPFFQYTVQPKAPVFISPIYGGTGYDSLTHGAILQDKSKEGYFTLNQAYGY
jgi:hypothetical protein